MAEHSNYTEEHVKGHIGASKLCHADWQTVAFSIPRNEIEKAFEDKELQYNGIYFLFGYKEGIEKVYVGQGKKRNSGESLIKRLREHDTSKDEPYRDKWEYAVAVTGLNNSWTEGQVSTLERVFYNMIPKERLLNDRVPRGDLSIDCEEKIRQIKAFLQKIGLETFTENSTTQELSIQEIKEESLKVEDIHCGTKDVPEIMTPRKIVRQMLDLLFGEM